MSTAARPADIRTGSDTPEILTSMRRRIAALGLDLTGMTVVTEAATGVYACTAPIAAMAGARVHAVARDTRSYGTFEDAARATLALAAAAGVADRITVSRTLDQRTLASCDILTNSGHLRPISAETIGSLPRHAVIALMFEAWEFRGTDFDLDACRARGIRVAAVNERHPDVGVFPYLGALCANALGDAGLDLRGARIAVLCDNPFAPHLVSGLTQAGAHVTVHTGAAKVAAAPREAVVVALDPFRNARLDRTDLSALAAAAPGACLLQFWGDIDRDAADRVWTGPIWPPQAPSQGHMAVLLSDLGHEPVVRLQTGGLRAAQLLARGYPLAEGGVAEVL